MCRICQEISGDTNLKERNTAQTREIYISENKIQQAKFRNKNKIKR